jgi:hypothetical protein
MSNKYNITCNICKKRKEYSTTKLKKVFSCWCQPDFDVKASIDEIIKKTSTEKNRLSLSLFPQDDSVPTKPVCIYHCLYSYIY